MRPSILRVFLRQKFLFLTLFVISFIGILLLFNFVSPRYQTTARILIERKIFKLAQIENTAEISTILVRNELERLKSTTLFSQALSKVGLDPDPNRAAFSAYYSGLTVKQLPLSTILQIQMNGAEPKIITDLTNALVICLIEENKKLSAEEIQQTEDYLTSKLTELQTEKVGVQNELKSLNQEQIRKVTPKTWNDIKKQIAVYEKDFATLKNKLSAHDWDEASFIYTTKNQCIIDFQNDIRRYENALVAELVNPEPDPGKINALQSSIWQEKVKTVALMQKQLNPLELGLGPEGEKLNFAYLRVVDLRMRQDLLKNILENYKPKVVDPDVKAKLEERLSSLISMESELSQKLAALQINEGITDLEITWVDKAIEPNSPYFPTLLQRILISGLFGFGICMFFIYCCLLWESLQNDPPEVPKKVEYYGETVKKVD